MRHTWLLALVLCGCLDFDQLGMNAGVDLAAAPPDFAQMPARDGGVIDDKDLAPPSDFANFTCMTGEFLGCDKNDPNAVDFCNDTGDGVTVLPCGAQCKGGVDCGLCAPGSDVCLNGGTTICTEQGGFGQFTPCPPPLGGNGGTCFDQSSCVVCVPVHNGNVCGDGSMNFALDISYTCDTNTNQITGKTTCAFGCDPKNGACRDLVPANEAGQHLAQNDSFTCVQAPKQVLAKIAPDLNATIKIDSGTPQVIVNGAVVPGVLWGTPYVPSANAKTPVRVMHLNTFSVPAGSSVTVLGPYGVVLLADDQVNFTGSGGNNVISTRINFNGVLGGSPGPGGGDPQGQGLDGGNNGVSSTGGSGGGHGTFGGSGGDGANGLKGPVGGSAYGLVKAVEPIEGGSHGGRGGFSINAQQTSTPGGFGGGALQVTACNVVSVGAGTVLNGSGSGGKGGIAGVNQAPGTGGGGGGSAGTLILEAAQVNVAGELVLNGGGGGGGGCGVLNCNGGPGFSWDPSMPPATAPKGGPSGLNGGGAGGNGGSINVQPGNGAQVADAQGSGGGGGAVGRIYVNISPISQVVPAFGANASPMPTVSRACVTIAGQAPQPCLY